VPRPMFEQSISRVQDSGIAWIYGLLDVVPYDAHRIRATLVLREHDETSYILYR
jgi:hypothetical protein